jgi:hypothetical protein
LQEEETVVVKQIPPAEGIGNWNTARLETGKNTGKTKTH